MKELLTNTTDRLLCSAVESLARAATEHRTQAKQSLELLNRNIREFRDIAAKILDVTLMGADRGILEVEDPDRFFQMLNQMQSPFATPEILRLFPHVEIVSLIADVMEKVLETLAEKRKEIPAVVDGDDGPSASAGYMPPPPAQNPAARKTTAPGGNLEQTILEKVRSEGEFRNARLFAETSGVSGETVNRVLRRLVQDGILKIEGATSKTRYILNPEQRPPATAHA